MTSELVLVSRTGALLDNPDFEALIADYYPRILRAALVMTGSSWAAEDLAQETFLQAMRSWLQFERQSRIDTWLYSILLNLHRKQLRSAARSWRRWLVWFEGLGLHRKNQSPEGNAEQDEWRESLWMAVSELPVPQKEASVGAPRAGEREGPGVGESGGVERRHVHSVTISACSAPVLRSCAMMAIWSSVGTRS